MKLLPFLLLLFVIPAYSQKDTELVAPWWVEKYKVVAGFFVPVNNTEIGVGVKGGANGTEIDFEKDLGYATNVSTFLGGVQWRATRRSRFSLTYYRIDRNSNHTITEDITFKDQTYTINASINSFFNTTIYQFSYGYAILSKPNYEAGVLIGSHIVGGKVGMAINTSGGSVSGNTDFGFTAPLPDLGLWGGVAFSDRWALNAEGDYLSASVNDVSGSIFAYSLSVLFKASERFNVTGGYTGLNFDVKGASNGYEGRFKWGYNGPSLAVTYWFGKKGWKH